MAEFFLEKCISRYNETYWYNRVLKVHHVKCTASRIVSKKEELAGRVVCN